MEKTMRRKIVYLDLRKAQKENLIVNREEFMKKYDSGTYNMTMLKGTPLLQNVEGSYIYTTDILSLASIMDKAKIERLWAGIDKGYIEYRWHRG